MRHPHTIRGAWLALSIAAVLSGTGCSTARTDHEASAAPGSACASGTSATFSNGASVCGSQAAVTPAGGSAVAVNTYLGIRYARADRFQPPQLTPPAGSNVPQTMPGAFCPQPNSTVFPNQSEDCLYLNVFTPQSALGASRPLPVLFFIHGGAFVEGSGYQPSRNGNILDGSYLAATGNMVVVTINYRLGALGFLAIDDPVENPSIAGPLTGNFGILDQQAALKWVQQYIGTFGGDPARVTVAGESAGAMSTGLHLFAAPGSAQLFQAAIMESNPAGSVYRTTDRAQQMGARFHDHLCKIVNNCGTARQPLPVLRTASANQIIAAQSQVFIPRAIQGAASAQEQKAIQALAATPVIGILGEGAPQTRDGLPWSPTLDGTVIAGQPLAGYATARSGPLPAKPFVFGINRDEGVVFADMAYLQLDKKLFPFMVNDMALGWVWGNDRTRITGYTVQGAAPYKAPAASAPSYMDNGSAVTLSNIINDFAFRCANLAMAGRGAAANAKASPALPAFGYLFAQAPIFNLYRDKTGAPVPACQPDAGSVCHANEIPYVFNTVGHLDPQHPVPRADQALSQTMAAAWASFVNNPSSPAPWAASGSLPTRWAPYAGLSSQLTQWNTAGDSSVSASRIDQGANCSALWNTIAPIAGN
ncbi:carboxylesterase family protein [Paracidovorax citrulli]|uniref:carboxylesterase family protein n=1 Tax=Paracidovorax citrulli TaxID=80869 RepID=UPI000306EB5B|nr:carboxylesterase family protein [Paracidovorax citrulli]QCX10751.1 Para-nitrobenzyl esterase [Paracidovorax citrulli]UEG46275.1 carboxylesterase family protein [Paracidovorax citrulli]UMT90452.1 carboxylesterase family protein [Paracidovorax citrulli]UMT94489.1 carboxylesterase family protein [Paracidovorax citrulli]WIY34732.1 carboxylesterase family protein [Paracidovorax citrulli]